LSIEGKINNMKYSGGGGDSGGGVLKKIFK